MAYCYECGKEVKKGKFCFNCGANFKEYANNAAENTEPIITKKTEINLKDEDKEMINEIIEKQVKKKRVISEKQKAHMEKLKLLRKSSKGAFVKADKLQSKLKEIEQESEPVKESEQEPVKEIKAKKQIYKTPRIPIHNGNPYFVNLM